MSRSTVLFTLILFTTLAPLSTHAQPRSGAIEADETWSMVDSPVKIEGILTIGKKAVLTIDPGVEIRFADQSGFIVRGILYAEGSEYDSIRFTSASEKSSGAWGGIYFQGQWTGPTRLDLKEKALAKEKATREEDVFEDGQGNTYKRVGQYYQRQDGKYFYETRDGDLKEYRGKVIVEEEAIVATLVDTLTVSYLKYCIIEYAGGSPPTGWGESGAAIEVAGSRPIISNSTIHDCIGRTGTIRVCNQSEPLIRDCLITNNSSLRGGAISVSLNSAPVIEGNTISFNNSDDNGGAIYISLSSAEIISNRFLGKEAGAHAGAIYCTMSQNLIIRGNVFMGNQSGSNSNSLYLTSRITAEIKENTFDSFESTGIELYLDNALIEQKPNPYGFIPFIIYPNLREPKKFWGMSDLPQIMESQRELNRAMSQLSRILELSGNPIAVLENVEESEDIAVRPGAVCNIPEDAKAYLLDLLQGGGVGLHINYIDLLYRTMHDVAESPRAAFGGAERDLSGVALEIELHPLLQKVKRKRAIRTAVYNRRSKMIIKLIEKYQGENFGNNRIRVVWGPILPRDRQRQVTDEVSLVQTGIHSRRAAMDELGIQDPQYEFDRWLEERRNILEMNKELNAKSTRGGARERALPSQAEGVEE